MAEFPALPLFTDAYLGDTTHLTTIEHGAYLLLLMVAWRSRDCRLPDDDRLLARYAKCTIGQWARIRPILEPFFSISSDGWVQGRLTDEAIRVRQTRDAQAANGRASALKRKGRHSTERQPIENQVRTPTPTPTPTKVLEEEPLIPARKRAANVEKPDDVEDRVWQDFQRLRKEKRAPITDTALAGIRREAQKANMSLNRALAECCERGWQGFKAEWIEGRNGNAENIGSASRARPVDGFASALREAATNVRSRDDGRM